MYPAVLPAVLNDNVWGSLPLHFDFEGVGVGIKGIEDAVSQLLDTNLVQSFTYDILGALEQGGLECKAR